MKVALVIEHLDAARGGAETSTLEMARLLAGAGVDVTIIASHRADQASRSFGDQPFRTELLSAPRWTRAQRTHAFLAAAEARVADAVFDVVHAIVPIRNADVYQPRGGTYLETIRRSVERGAPLMRPLRAVARRFNARQQLLLRAERDLLARTPPPVVAAVSDYVRRQVLEAAPGFPPEAVRVVLNGVEIQPLRGEHAAAVRAAERLALKLGATDSPIVLLVAHNFRLKGVAELIRAMAVPNAADSGGSLGTPGEVRRSEWTAVIVGRDRPEYYLRLALRLGVADRVRFIAPRRDIASLYAAADVVAHPTWYDPCSRVVLEALCCGLPVVTTRLNGAAEVIQPGRTGFVIDRPDDLAGLDAAIDGALAPQIRSACATQAEAMREKLSMRRHVAELMQLYGDVTSRRRVSTM